MLISSLKTSIRRIRRQSWRSLISYILICGFVVLVAAQLPALMADSNKSDAVALSPSQADGPAQSFGQAAEPAQSVGLVDLSELNGLESGVDLTTLTEEAPPDEGLFYRVYKVAPGDTISHIAQQYGVSTDSIITFNDVKNARTVQIGALLKIPNMNGILHLVRAGDTVEALAGSYSISADRIVEVNRLPDTDLVAGRRIFLPDARLSNIALREINGDLFTWPVRSYITSWYGWRNDPFTGLRAFHTGIDIGAPSGTTVRAAMDGVVRSTGYSATMGNYVILAHHSGYSTLYAHLSSILVKAGTRVSTSTAIGRVGNTGYSTGPHLHFTVWKHGVTVNPMTLLR